MSSTLSGAVGPYQVERVLVSSPDAVLVDAIDTRLDRKVWLKVLTSALDKAARERFHREARALMAIEHPSVIMLYDYSGKDEKQAYIAFEPLYGPSLRKLLAERGPMPPDVHVAFFLQLASALDTLHTQGIAHRALSLDCVHLEEDGRSVIDDFAAAADVVNSDGTLVSRGTVIERSRLFVAPEVQRSGVATISGDVFGLGVLMASGWLGKAPLASTTGDTAPELAGSALLVVRQARPDVPSALAELTDSMVHAKTADARPTAKAVYDRLMDAWSMLGAGKPEERLHAWLRNEKAVTKSVQEDALSMIARGDFDGALKAALGARYERFEALGQGGMGRVMKAWDTRLQRAVAIKTMLDTSDPNACMRFHREARSLGRLRHPGIVEVIDYSGRGALVPYLVLELVDGANMSTVLQVALLPETEALCVMYLLCEAAAVVHREGLVHRDLKPDNIFTEESGRIVIGDFGIVRGTKGKHETFVRTETQSIGSPKFASPEQLFDPDTVGPPSDVFSLGSVLHALLTGKSPFDSSKISETYSLLSAGKAAPLPSSASPYVVALRKRMLALKEDERPTTAELADDLRAELSRRRVLDVRQRIREFLGSEEQESKTKIFDATRVAKRRDVTEPASSTTTQVPSQRELTAAKKKPSRVLPLAAAAFALVVLVAAGIALRPRAKPVEAPLVAATPTLPPAPVEMILPTPPPAETVPKPDPPPPDTPPPVAPKKPASVRFIPRPWAKVIVDGEARGTTPVFNTMQLAPGRHVIRFENPSFKPKTVNVELKSGEQRDVRVTLEK